MDMFEEVAARRWQETETSIVTKITEAIFAHPGNEGWSIASIYSYIYPGYTAYPVTIWKNSGTKNGYAVVQIKGMLVTRNNDTGNYELVNIVKIL